MPFHRKNLKIKDDLSTKKYGDTTFSKLILRDHLAIDRTMLSAENTFLSYVRTSLTVLAAGVTLIHFSSNVFVKIIGVLISSVSIFLFTFGLKRTSKLKNKIYSSIKKNADKVIGDRIEDRKVFPIVNPLDPQIFQREEAEIKVSSTSVH